MTCTKWTGATLAVTLAGALLWAQAAPTAQGPRVVKIVGDQYKLVLRDDGSVVGWGLAHQGQLGPLAALALNDLRVAQVVSIQLPGKAVDIAASGSTPLAVLDDGSVVGWGEGNFGQLGVDPAKRTLLSSSTQSMSYRGIEEPRRIPGLAGVVSIAASSSTAYAVLNDGTVRAWGRGTIGDGRAPKVYGAEPSKPLMQLTPVRVPGLDGVIAMSANGGHVLALTKSGRVYSWGSNFYGALGRAPREEQIELDTPGEVTGLTDIIAVASGLGVSTALRRDGTVWVWGANWNSQFGFGVRTDPPGSNTGFDIVPKQVPGVSNVVEISLGLGRHTLARLKDGTVRAWGNNDWGQAGTGLGTGFQERPVAIKIANVSRIFAVGNNSFAIRADGSLWAWGSGGAREFPFKTNVRLPTKVDLW